MLMRVVHIWLEFFFFVGSIYVYFYGEKSFSHFIPFMPINFESWNRLKAQIVKVQMVVSHHVTWFFQIFRSICEYGYGCIEWTVDLGLPLSFSLCGEQWNQTIALANRKLAWFSEELSFT